MKEYFEKNKETIKPLSKQILFFTICLICSLVINYLLTTYVSPRLESIPLLLFFVITVFIITKREYRYLTVENPGKVSLKKFKEIYEKYGYSILLSGYVEHQEDECVVAYKNDQEKDRVLGTSAFWIFNRYIKIPFVFDYTKDRVIIKSQKVVLNLDEISKDDLEEFNPNISNFLRLEYKLSSDKKKIELKVSDGSKLDMRLNYKNFEQLKNEISSSAF
ncbi:hypothetical protein Q5O14_09040 [Eubacteriaceae bacterium ES2]|nr:hypothetical protein Q5O14_09040 [Eubacteriaceae bacterium ES2]